MVKLLDYNHTVLRLAIYVLFIIAFRCNYAQEIISLNQISKLTKEVDIELRSQSPKDGVKFLSCTSSGRLILFKYEVSDDWEPVENIEDVLQKNSSENKKFNRFCNQNQIDRSFSYYRKNGFLVKSITINHKHEFSGNYNLTRHVSVKGHEKAKGVDLQIKYPNGWELEEGNRPNIVKKFTRNGSSYMIIINEGETFFSRKEVEKLLDEEKEEFVKTMINGLESDVYSSLEVLGYKIVNVDLYPSLQVQYKGFISNTLMNVKTRFCTISWTIIYEDKVVTLMGLDITKDFSNQNLFRLITNSVMFPEQYID